MFGISLEDIIIVITNTNRITGVKNPHTGHKPIIKLERAMKCKSEKTYLMNMRVTHIVTA